MNTQLSEKEEEKKRLVVVVHIIMLQNILEFQIAQFDSFLGMNVTASFTN